MSNQIMVPTMIIRPDGIVCYDFWNGDRRKNKTSFLHVSESESYQQHDSVGSRQANDNYRGVLTPSSRKKLQWYINCLVASAKWKDAYNSRTDSWFKFKVNFVTLTLSAPQRDIQDKEIKAKILSKWVDTMRAAYGLHNYVWRAERQYNGNIHFHITTDTYLPYDAICSTWNHFQGEFHFIREFREKNDSPSPNSTDVHSIQKIENLAAYMVKYMSKDPEEHLAAVNAKKRKLGQPEIDPENHPWRSIPGQPKWNDPIQGRVWDASNGLKKAQKLSFPMSTKMFQVMDHITQNYPERCFYSDHALYIDMADNVKKIMLPKIIKSG
jgi:hypothetical protein